MVGTRDRGVGRCSPSLARRQHPPSSLIDGCSEELSVFAGLDGDGTNRSAGPRRGRTCSSTSSAASVSGTRCSMPAFILDSGLRHSRASGSISSQVARRASPDRQAASTTNRRDALADTDGRETWMMSSAVPASWYGSARKCALTAGSDGRAPSMASPARLCSTWPCACAQASVARMRCRTLRPISGWPSRWVSARGVRPRGGSGRRADRRRRGARASPSSRPGCPTS